jgi:hypothetical protein
LLVLPVQEQAQPGPRREQLEHPPTEGQQAREQVLLSARLAGSMWEPQGQPVQQEASKLRQVQEQQQATLWLSAQPGPR